MGVKRATEALKNRYAQALRWNKDADERKGDYKNYTFKRSEFAVALGKSVGVMIMFALLFYRSVLPLAVFVLFIPEMLRIENIRCQNKRKKRLLVEFKEGIQALGVCLQSGYSLENCFRKSLEDIKNLLGQDSMIYGEFLDIANKLEANYPVEVLIQDLGERSGLEDIKEFAEIVSIGKRSGGNLIEIILEATQTISKKVETEQEIQSALASRAYEMKIMNIIPLGIILYLNISSPGYMEALYINFAGRIIMSLCLAVYLVSYVWSRRIVSISV